MRKVNLSKPQIPLPENDDTTLSLSTGIMPKSGTFHVVAGEDLFMTGTITTHDPLRECSSEFNYASEVRVKCAELLDYYQLESSSNSLLTECNMEDYSCLLNIGGCSFDGDPDESILLILDSHFQILQVGLMRAYSSY